MQRQAIGEDTGFEWRGSEVFRVMNTHGGSNSFCLKKTQVSQLDSEIYVDFLQLQKERKVITA